MADIKSTSNAAWWIKHPKKHQHHTTFHQDMTDLLCNISMHGYNKLLKAELLLYEKLLWLCLYVVNFIVVIVLLSYAWEQFVSNYFSVYLHDPLYPIEKIPFPGVSICTNNRISREAAAKYARELSLRDPYNRSAEQFIKYITYFNSMYYKFQRDDDFNGYAKFQAFLDLYDTRENETYFNIRKTLKMLTPNCTDFIVKCFLNGKPIECFGDDAFRKGFTMYGPCCVFNVNNSYKKRNSTFHLKSPKLGLMVLLNSSHSDDVVTLLNMDAYVVLIHNPDDFPDTSAGSALEVFPTNNVESLVGVRAEFTDASEQLRNFHPSYRKCYFNNETDMIFGGKYSFSNCVINCRIRGIVALCNCVPFYVKEMLQKIIGVPYCNLNHIRCLQRYDFKWRSVLTKHLQTLGLEREEEEGLHCDQCLPSCYDVQYYTSMMSLPTDRLLMPDNVGSDFNLKLEEMSVLRIYFAESTAPYYKRVVNNDWEEAFSIIGNILSIFMGFSMVAVFEMLFFVIKYLHKAIKALKSTNNGKPHKRPLRVRTKKLYILP